MSRNRSALRSSGVLLTSCTMVWCGATCGSQELRLPAVAGEVRYSSMPLSGVTIELRTAGQDGQVEQTTVTDQAGEYRFDDVADGIHVVRVSAPTPEYFETSSQVTVAGPDVTLNLSLAKIITLLAPPDGATVATDTPVLTWVANDEAAKYTVRVNVTSTWQLAERASDVSATSHTLLQALTSGENYSWQVDATDTAGRLVGSTQTPFTFTAQSP
jgi:hypothetical protein